MPLDYVSNGISRQVAYLLTSRACDDDDLPATEGGTGLVAQSGTKGIAAFFGAAPVRPASGKRKRDDEVKQPPKPRAPPFFAKLGVASTARF
jgi:hypothetical protein